MEERIYGGTQSTGKGGLGGEGVCGGREGRWREVYEEEKGVREGEK